MRDKPYKLSNSLGYLSSLMNSFVFRTIKYYYYYYYLCYIPISGNTALFITEDSGLHTYLVGLIRRVLTDTTSSRRPQDPFVLFKLLQRLAPAVVGGSKRFL